MPIAIALTKPYVSHIPVSKTIVLGLILKMIIPWEK